MNNPFPGVISELLKQHGMTQTELAERVGLHRQAVSQWVHGLRVPSYDKLRMICSIFHVSADYLLQVHETRSAWNQEAAKKELAAIVDAVEAFKAKYDL